MLKLKKLFPAPVYFLFSISFFCMAIVAIAMVLPDSDGDGLADLYDFNTNNFDTDGDGIYDGADVDGNGDTIFETGSASDSDTDGIHDDADMM